jgi:hypothetical protein
MLPVVLQCRKTAAATAAAATLPAITGGMAGAVWRLVLNGEVKCLVGWLVGWLLLFVFCCCKQTACLCVRPTRHMHTRFLTAAQQESALVKRLACSCVPAWQLPVLLPSSRRAFTYIPVPVCLCVCHQVLWIPEYFKARGAHSASLYAETFAVAAANLPGEASRVHRTRAELGCQAKYENRAHRALFQD